MTLEVVVGEREQAEEAAAERAVGEGAHRGAVVRDARRPRGARGRVARTDRGRRRAPPCVRAAHPPAPRRRPVARPPALRRRDPTPRRRASVPTLATRATRSRAPRGRCVRARRGTGASARASPLVPATTVTGTRVASTRSNAAAGVDSSCGRCTITAPRSASNGTPAATSAAAASMRSRSSYHSAASDGADASADAHDIGRPRPVRTNASSAASSRFDSSRCAATSAASVAGCSATGRNRPGASTSTARTARGEHRYRHRPPVRGGELRRPEQFGEAERGEERDPGDAVSTVGDAPEGAAAEQSAGGHTDVVGGDHDRDRRQRVARLRRHHRGVQRTRRVGAVRDRRQLDGHRPGSYDRGATRIGVAARRFSGRGGSAWVHRPCAARGGRCGGTARRGRAPGARCPRRTPRCRRR